MMGEWWKIEQKRTFLRLCSEAEVMKQDLLSVSNSGAVHWRCRLASYSILLVLQPPVGYLDHPLKNVFYSL